MQIQIVEKGNKDYSEIEVLYNAVRLQLPFLAEISDFEKALNGEIVYEVFIDNKLIAFISLWEPDNFIHYLFVHPNFQGMGIGEQMINHIIKTHRMPIGLKCLSKNIIAVRFYEKNGFYEKYRGTSEDGEYIYFELSSNSN